MSMIKTISGLLPAKILSLAVLVTAVVALPAEAATSVWKVHGKGNSLYIAGTLHLLKAEDFPLPAQFDLAYQNSEGLVLEADLEAFSQPGAQMELSKQATWQDGSDLSDHVRPETLERLRTSLETYGIPIEMIMGYKPGAAATTVALLELQKLGISQAGVDAHYDRKARDDGREIEGLETLEQQMTFIAEMGMDNPDAFLNYSLDDLEGLEAVMGQMTAAWRKGDMNELAILLTEEMRSMYPEVYKNLLTDRNEAWLPKLLEMLEDPDVELVMVGAGHLAGKGNVLELLEKAGMKVEQLP